ncbi:MAG TPA: FkbM family methyltransferase [Puia sp.]|nr:FkbM family methyltransferase [Puia sp.]
MTYKLSHLKQLLKLSGQKAKEVYSKCSYSQCGEDMIVDYIFRLRGVHQPSYIDIGANHPFFLSNTAFFYEKGCRGINIEANPRQISLFQKYRNGDINLNFGVGPNESEMDFYIMEDNTLSTFSKRECDFLITNGKTLSEIKKVKLVTIENILEKYCNRMFPDFMSIDVEGMDFEIMEAIDYNKSFPKVVCIEAAEYSPVGAGSRKKELIDFLVSKNYYEYANTNLNAIMVNKEFWFV